MSVNFKSINISKLNTKAKFRQENSDYKPVKCLFLFFFEEITKLGLLRYLSYDFFIVHLILSMLKKVMLI